MLLELDSPARRALIAAGKQRFARAAFGVDVAWMMSWLSLGFLLLVSVAGPLIGIAEADLGVFQFGLFCVAAFYWSLLYLLRLRARSWTGTIKSALLRGPLLEKSAGQLAFQVHSAEPLEGELPLAPERMLLLSSAPQEVLENSDIGDEVQACVLLAERGGLKRYTEMVILEVASRPAIRIASSQ